MVGTVRAFQWFQSADCYGKDCYDCYDQLIVMIVNGKGLFISLLGSSSELHNSLGEAMQDSWVFVCREELGPSSDSARRCGENPS